MPDLLLCTPAETAERLADLPGWQSASGALERVYETVGFKGALLLATTIGTLCEMAWHHPDLTVSFGRLGVRLSTHEAKGITARDFELAARIEAVVGWQPYGALTGPPAGKALLRRD